VVTPTACVAIVPQFDEVDWTVIFAGPHVFDDFVLMRINLDKGFWRIDAETKRALFVNQAYETITGHSCQSLRDDPTSYEDLIHSEDRAHVLAKLDEATRTGHFTEKFRIRSAEGAIRWVWVRGFPVRDASGRILRLVGTALEITTQKEAEEQVAANLALAKSAWAEAEALRKATLSLTQDLRMEAESRKGFGPKLGRFVCQLPFCMRLRRRI
jgi:PAS domain S-box-containing protein